ncbi:GAF domain-containing protein [Prauserella oleivorans]
MIRLVDPAQPDLDVAEHAKSVAQHCAGTLGVDAAGVLLAYPEPPLRALGASDPLAHRLIQLQTGRERGPAAECYRRGQPISVPDLGRAGFDAALLAEADRRGFRSLHAIPVWLRGEVVGVGELFSHEPGPLSPATHDLAQALLGAAPWASRTAVSSARARGWCTSCRPHSRAAS